MAGDDGESSRAEIRRRRSEAPRSRRAPSEGPAGALIAMGASTGGVEALGRVLRALPADAPPIVIVQHMPPGFTRRFAERCDGHCLVAVKEAADGDALLRGQALIAPGEHHLRITAGAARVAVGRGPRVNGHCPSVDVLFESVARHAGPLAVGVLLTGMGRDGAAGLLSMRRSGARTIAQDEATCVVFGMPEVAISLGAVDWVLPIDAIADRAMEASRVRVTGEL